MHKIIRNSLLAQAYPELTGTIMLIDKDYLHSLIFTDDSNTVITMLSYIWDTRKCVHAMQFKQDNAEYAKMLNILQTDADYDVKDDNMVQIFAGEAYMMPAYAYAFAYANSKVFTRPRMLNLTSKTDKSDKSTKNWFINGIEVATSTSEVMKINSVGEGGRLSNLRDRTAKCHSYSWNYAGLQKALGYIDDIDRYKQMFTAVTGGRYGGTGTAMNYHELKACIDIMQKRGFNYIYNR